jgi:hypothetical protein
MVVRVATVGDTHTLSHLEQFSGQFPGYHFVKMEDEERYEACCVAMAVAVPTESLVTCVVCARPRHCVCVCVCVCARACVCVCDLFVGV